MNATQEYPGLRLTCGAILNDRRGRVERFKGTIYRYVVFHDRFMSGWGGAPGRSFYVLAVRNPAELDVVMANGEARSEMRLFRVLENETELLTMGLRRGDHVSVAPRKQASRWYVAGAFSKKE